ncbi:hypothetical protein OG585_48955 (plasmid) [Streptomyces sp. NBC_01340]|uniref:hypothetical protein n=1 Tax=unclassified Streptomyces TaxID=2593676 RepID=UPI00225672A0|nr:MULTISPECIES: hypothetical protein [unclassified Streptomyces]MCX4460909.1 hypothetical protein [Streptomyces sp. NBC_01719]MCX4499761.1 hypothetical protein [Streptomyces sp. NBC_01728]WSI44911.1 hypothetical protein OG585_48955 [Streptomyces sp. NBC_01340]
MGRRNDARHNAVHGHTDTPAETARDRFWAQDLRSSIRCAGVLLALLLLIDWGAGTFTALRAVLWAGLAALLFVVLFPHRVTVGEGWLASQGLLRRRRVRTDLLVSVRCLDGISQRLVLRDTFGDRVEIDPKVLVNNPDLWRRLDEDAHKAAACGSLTCGQTALRRVSEQVDRETALTVFKVSGLE